MITHTHKHTQTRCTNLKRGGSEGVCRGETKDQTTECLCLLRLRGNRRSTLNISIKTEMYPWKTSLKPPLFFLECHVGVNDSSLYMWCSVYITFPLHYSHTQAKHHHQSGNKNREKQDFSAFIAVSIHSKVSVTTSKSRLSQISSSVSLPLNCYLKPWFQKKLLTYIGNWLQHEKICFTSPIFTDCSKNLYQSLFFF